MNLRWWNVFRTHRPIRLSHMSISFVVCHAYRGGNEGELAGGYQIRSTHLTKYTSCILLITRFTMYTFDFTGHSKLMCHVMNQSGLPDDLSCSNECPSHATFSSEFPKPFSVGCRWIHFTWATLNQTLGTPSVA